jgi:hypothetical protein
MRNSLKKHILDYLKSRYPDWVEGYIIEDLTKGYGYLASNGLRRARELENQGIIKRDDYRGSRGERLVKYRYIVPDARSEKEKFLKETNRIKVEIVTMPNGERRAKEVIL